MEASTSPHTIYDLFKTQNRQIPDNIAITAPAQNPLTYGRLLAHIEKVVNLLRSHGVGRNDRVATALPNGPEMVVTFLAIAAGATVAPLNPAYRADEFDFYLRDLKAKALIVQAGLDSPARAVAQAQNIPILELSPTPGAEAGISTLAGNSPLLPVHDNFAQPADVALMLHTSGTTSRPKLVPLTQANLFASAYILKDILKLTTADRCLNIMPLFHTHGLMVALSSLLAGGAVICPPTFEADQFFKWMRDFCPTWYSAAPTIHQEILTQAKNNREIIENCPLRFIRSSAAALPPQVMAALENVFNTPVVEGYGLTETALYATNNPLPPHKRKAGSVGIATGTEITILDKSGNRVPPNEIGEIVLRGSNITAGYENNPEANQRDFTNGWFKTGDLGLLDDEGYLYITGRLKEIINRGGEKISPGEVDEVLMGHPAVMQAATFAVPHPTLGEDLAAAIVLKKEASATPQEIRAFAFSRLIDYKIPSQVLIVDEIPKGPTGKLQRLGLAEKLAGKLKAVFVAPQTELEKSLAAIWIEVLKLEQIGLNDNFFALGGDSLLGTQVVGRLRKQFQIELPLHKLFEAPTIVELAVAVEQEKSQAPVVRPSAIKPIPRGRRTVQNTSDQTEPPLQKQTTVSDNQTHIKTMQFGLFFFSADGSTVAKDKYRLFLESTKYADQNGFSSVWTPERHFHAFGGLYPSPSLLGAAIAPLTSQIQIRAGATVLPLQDPIRVAEEWAVIDNLSGGRAGLACASGWHVNDFILSPANYDDRKKIMFERLEIIQKLWQGESVKLPNGANHPTEVKIFPRPLQPELPIWLASHSDESFIKAGQMGIHILTTLWNTTTEELSRQIALYRNALADHGHQPESGLVTLMLHTFIGETMGVVQEKVQSAYDTYLEVNLGLQQNLVQGLKQEFNLTEEDREFIITEATDRLLQTRGLIGTPATCFEKVKLFQSIGINEIACLIDFGTDFESTMTNLEYINKLKTMCSPKEN